MSATVLAVLGTRPEAIKMAPLIREIERRDGLDVRVCVTAQHREMLDQALDAFGIDPDYDLDLMETDQSLHDVAAGALRGVGRVIDEMGPALVAVQGDTTTAMAGALAAYYSQVPVAHIEAGLRTGNKYSPFPEEINRAVIDIMADLNFPPTAAAQDNLLAAGVSEDGMSVTGNTAIDAVLLMKEITRALGPGDPQLSELPSDLVEMLASDSPRRLALVTGHRRESFGEDLESICLALKRLASERADVEVAYPVHLNPRVREPVYRILGDVDHVRLFEPPAYPAFIWLLQRSHIVITDSGGIQEEAPALDKPVLVTRSVTERPEAIEAGCARLVGTDTMKITEAATRLLDDHDLYEQMASSPNPFGDGRASERIATAIERWLNDRE